MKRPVEAEDEEHQENEKHKKMRRVARAKANQMSRAVSPTPSIQTIDQISEEERQEILKYVETEQVEVSGKQKKSYLKFIASFSIIYLIFIIDVPA